MTAAQTTAALTSIGSLCFSDLLPVLHCSALTISSASFYSYLKSLRGGTHKAPIPAEKLLAKDGCWGRKSPFSLGQWILVGCSVSSEWSSTMHMQAALIGLSENSKEDMKVQGGCVGIRRRGRKRWDRYDLDTLHTYMKSSKNEKYFKKICCNTLFLSLRTLPYPHISEYSQFTTAWVLLWCYSKTNVILGEKNSQGKISAHATKERPFSEHRLRSAWKAMRRNANVLVQESCLLLLLYMVTGNLFLSILNRAEDQCKYISVLAHNRSTREGSKQISYPFRGTRLSR